MMKNLSPAFIAQMETLLGAAATAQLQETIQGESPVSIRLNPTKPVEGASNIYNKVCWCDDGRYLSSRPQFTFDPLLHAGNYYVQEASSMALCQIFRQYLSGPLAVLDLCAAPGGKSTLLRACLHKDSILICNEILRNRAQVLAENMVKWGH
ncbi:MAG: rRNA cytosine-C5-methyltransferase, partial [Bacteroidaceae bacterium]|nr:rRNA cytosine-C5-methyltransferase [Bacteroidaceae bacterium]